MHPLAILSLLLIFAHDVKAECQCLWQGPFADVQGATDLVTSGTVVSRKGNSIDLKIDRRLRGDTATESLRIWLQAKDYCRPAAEQFPIGSQWVMALHKINTEVSDGFNPRTPNISYGRQGDFSLSSCGGYWLSQTENRVTGNLVDATRWEHNPKMTPVLLDLVDAYVKGDIERSALVAASREDPALRELMLDTRSFIRSDK